MDLTTKPIIFAMLAMFLASKMAIAEQLAYLYDDLDRLTETRFIDQNVFWTKNINGAFREVVSIDRKINYN